MSNCFRFRRRAEQQLVVVTQFPCICKEVQKSVHCPGSNSQLTGSKLGKGNSHNDLRPYVPCNKSALCGLVLTSTTEPPNFDNFLIIGQ